MTGIAGGCLVGAGATPQEPTLPEPTLTVHHHTRCAWLGLPERWKMAW